MKIVFKDIPNYEGLYQMNNISEVLNVKRNRIVKQKINDGKYYQFKLSKDNKRQFFYAHKMLGILFLPNPDNLPQINHKGENKLENIVYINDDGTIDYSKTTIEWCDAKYNCNYGTRNNRIREKLLNNRFKSREVVKFNMDKEYITNFPSAAEATRQTGISSSNIRKCCLLQQKFAGNKEEKFKWSYKHKSTIQLDDAPCEYDATYCIIPI